MSFNPDYTKPAHKVIFSRKRSETHRPWLMINNVPVKRVPFHKHLGLILDSKPSFNEHIDTMLSKVQKIIENTGKLYQELELESLQKICFDHTPPYLHNLTHTNFQSSYS